MNRPAPSIRPLRDVVRWAPARIPLTLHASGARERDRVPADCNAAQRSGRRAGTQRNMRAPMARTVSGSRP